MSVFSSLLFKPGFSTFVSKLNDDKSMFSIAVRDGVDNTGRGFQELKRDPHGGRERFFEDFMTLVIWGFGINFMKRHVYDRIARRWLAHPDLDTQWVAKLKTQRVQEFVRRFPGVYDGVLDAVTNPALMRRYEISNWLKLGICTGIPVGIIAFGIPAINHWYTRRMIAQEKRQKAQQQAPMGYPPPQNQTIANNPFALNNSRPRGYGSIQTPPVFNTPFAQTPFTPPMPRSTSVPHFGLSAGKLASTIIQQERYNTMLVDGVISGGRIGTARNKVERFEQAFKEGAIVFFLYFAQRPIQNFVSAVLNKLRGVDSAMSPDVLDGLWKHYQKNPKQVTNFSLDVLRSNQYFHQNGMLPSTAALHEDGVFKKIVKFLTFRRAKIKLPDPKLVEHMQDLVQQYFLEGESGNLVIDTAIQSRAIPTFDLQGKKLLDLTKAIDSDRVLNIAHQLEGFAEKAEINGGLMKVLKRSKGGMVVAMLAANAVCAVALSYVVPKIQHYLTFLKTGRDYFPGVEEDKLP